MNPSSTDPTAASRGVLDDVVEHRVRGGDSGEDGGHRVVAVLVCHNGSPFLDRTLAALARLETPPARLVAVDVGSQDATVEILSSPGSPVSEVIRVPPGTGFATAVHAGVEAAGASDWVWVLHDDSAPEPTSLRELLAAGMDQPSVAVVGPKVLGWDEPRRLLEVGVSISRSGRRHTGLEPYEQDQGQYEGQRDVLAVGSAGLLARREAWDVLGGFDRSLRLFREDVDFGWRANLAGHRVIVVPDAVVHHAEAAGHGRRELVVRQLHQQDRASALYVLLANSSRLAFVPRWLWLLLVSLLRAVGFLLGKSPQEAAGEVGAIGQVLLRPRPIRRGRRSRARHKVVSQGSLRSLFPPPGQQLRQSLETVVGALTVNAELQPSSVLETGPGDEDIDSFGSQGSGRLRRAFRRPGTLLFLGLLVIGLLAWRGLYRDGVLHGGALLPVPSGASDVWHTYVASWHPVSVGSPVVAHPSMAVVGGLAFLLLGKATWVVPLVLVLGPALAGVLTYVTTAAFGLSTRLRVWAAVAYALNPAMLSAISQARWGTVLVAVLLPLLGLALARATGAGGREPSGRAAAAAALLLTVVTAAAPSVWVPLALLGVLAGLRFLTELRDRLRLLAVILAPAALLVPWLPQVVADPTVLLLDSGLPLASDDSPPWHVLLLSPGGLTTVPLLLGAGLVVAGVAAAARAAEVRAVRAALVVAAVGLGWALVLDSITVTPEFMGLAVAPWAGTPLVLATAGLVTAAVVAARSTRRRLERRALSWQQPAVAVVTAFAVLTPVVAAVWWVDHGAAGPVERGVANPLPAFVRAQSELPDQIRTLVLKPENGRLTYTLLRQRAAEFGDVEISPPAARLTDLDEIVADLASGRGTAPVDRLAQYAVQYVLAVPPVDPSLETALDSAPGVLRVANPGESSLWRIESPAGRLRLVQSDGVVDVLPSEPVDTTVDVPAGTGERLLELSELADPGWAATDAGEVLDSRDVAGWAEGFVVPAAGGQIEVTHRDPLRLGLFVTQAVLWLVVVVMALPSRRREPEAAV
jgi:GT2 family glycosyltransferase